MLKYRFEVINEGVSRLYVPFESVATSVFLVKSMSGYILIDCATTKDDVNDIIIPAIRAEGIGLSSIRYILLTHRHSDHAGGLDELIKHIPKAVVGMSRLASERMPGYKCTGFDDGNTIDNTLTTYLLPGHTDDCMGYYHIPTKSIISGDCVQQYGIGKYGCGLEYPSMYRRTLERLLADEDIENIITSHEYTPLGDSDYGREAYEAHIECCIEYDELIREFLEACSADGVTDAKEIERLFKETYSEFLPGILMLPERTIKGYLEGR
ncbi:MAG: MBL fold metallo-hydrolase [Clostridia bacterium]|nr:MBL fold metallo-hydrolase [Clostridia bacterium]